MNEPTEVVSVAPPGELLRAKRKEFGLRVEDIARELFLSVSQVRAIEKGHHD